MNTPEKKALVLKIREKVGSDKGWACRVTIVGSNSVDADILTSLAKQLTQRTSSTSCQQVAFRRLPKYARQLAAIAEKKALEVSK